MIFSKLQLTAMKLYLKTLAPKFKEKAINNIVNYYKKIGIDEANLKDIYNELKKVSLEYGDLRGISPIDPYKPKVYLDKMYSPQGIAQTLIHKSPKRDNIFKGDNILVAQNGVIRHRGIMYGDNNPLLVSQQKFLDYNNRFFGYSIPEYINSDMHRRKNKKNILKELQEMKIDEKIMKEVMIPAFLNIPGYKEYVYKNFPQIFGVQDYKELKKTVGGIQEVYNEEIPHFKGLK